MKLGTAQVDGTARLVVGTGEDDLVVAEPGLTMIDAITGRADAAIAQALASGAPRPAASVSWLPPVPRPGKVMCVALNNSANTDRIMSGPTTPATFIKPSSSLVGHGQPIRLRTHYGRVHPEPELAVVIGRSGADIPVSDALGHVFGYTIMNDLTSPTMRGEDTFHYRAIHPKTDGTDGISYVDTWVSYSGRYKGADTFGPVGPWIATADAIPDPHDLTVTCSHQGRVVTEDNTVNLLHSVAEVIAYLSEYMTLEPGDLVSMGTALKPSAQGGAVQNVDLVKLGGPIEVSISGIGTLSNPVEIR